MANEVYAEALKRFAELTGGPPTREQTSTAPVARVFFEQHQLRLFHGVIQLVLDAVNRAKGNEAELNVVTGEDLLYTVGRLSMMLNDADYLPSDTRPTPHNWTRESFLRERPQLQDQAVGTIVARLGESQRQQHAPSRRLTAYEGDVRFRVYSILQRKLKEQMGDTFPLKWTEGDLNILNALIEQTTSSLFSDSDRQQLIKSLAYSNKRFLVLVGVMPPQSLLDDPARRDAVVEVALSLGRLLKKRANLLLQTHLENNSMPELPKARRNDLSSKIKTLEGAFKKDSDAVELVKWRKKGEFRNMDLPWGGHHAVGLAYAGSVRLIFSQALAIMNAIGDQSSAALDLSYERIVDYLDRLPREEVTTELQAALGNPLAVRNAFFGELGILLVGIEGSQNNMAVMQAPMVMDLISMGRMTWAQALFQRLDIPFFVMGADKTEKGKKPLERHSKVIQQIAFTEEERRDETFPKFENFLQRELDLNALFLKTFFPALARLDENSQLIMSALIIQGYLRRKFNLSLKACRTLDAGMERLLGPLLGRKKGTSGAAKKQGASTAQEEAPRKQSQESHGTSGLPLHDFVPSPSGQVYPAMYGLPTHINQIVSQQTVAEWYLEISTGQVSRPLLARLDQMIVHLDWQTAELEPDPYERQMFANRVVAYRGPSQEAFQTWKQFVRFVELRERLTR
ncbi:hypothetical protein [Corallococcus sp. EGB]|uniref:hypothetical protein n=1 Tax=Corallococcus sp. EGB TaxID=1521117 RepID=UPI001CBB248A|nr:hypothetical protein [Corallococcus sp. EGB]